jgi:dUTP pyrophosphatase
MVTVNVKVLPHGEGLDLPAYETELAAGADIRAAVPESEPMVLKVGQRAMVPTGLAFAIPAGYEIQVRPRSGLSIKNGVTVINAPGTIDADYRGEANVLLINLGQEDFTVTRGMRIAQLVMKPVPQATFNVVESLDETERGEGGFGSTGL